MADKNTFEGTTTVGITCKDGVVFASERRASMGNLVAHKVAEKIFKIDNHIAATIAGSVADAQSLMKIISAETALYRLRNGKDISLEAAAAVSSNILHSSPAYVQTLIGGVDDTGASIYSLDAAGGMIKDTFISTGSGSTFAYGVLEDRFHEDITVEEAKELALRAIKAATERDTYSGNGFLVAEVTKDGYKMLEKEEVESIIEKINS
ncbi:MAG: archaeal proteasome endopeptidase complex subunit beta [Methanobrevibacter sp.]|mgnify:FL=1|jgi:proteasome beta subunit|uniref:archaeal proteasome endopeptidase complex subunit beta n=1 Tax=Methanobrevibacter sp. TaxID=66852 RepID=UPI001B25FFAF|nr:archaeal proteasome endopeptidase complex subunit beta [Methanobrevibacter sp.]MBO5840427.1 archaeal proteasome endopeptidase complex subunit beta [Methanobrevibacter sp.]MBO5965681.1 archaeal proteasome endopeptidase complex subunit beta [Methanobrevibacter sp.]MBO6104600.1 archaeal proteasome endopeptidase complex subunit beta [Methanobrevibacter sp.]MBO7159521.1 archaeal proteasome endopeptidase complex subunit beta [Methanobrevibacter sp.]MBO7209762.1 archaeal proteasome endopeptidase c